MGNDALLPQETGEQWYGKHCRSIGQRNLPLSLSPMLDACVHKPLSMKCFHGI